MILRLTFYFVTFASDKLRWFCENSSFASGKSRWFEKKRYYFATFASDKSRWLSHFFLRTAYSELQIQAYGRNPVENVKPSFASGKIEMKLKKKVWHFGDFC